MRKHHLIFLPFLLAVALPAMSQAYLPSGKLGPAEKLIIKSVDAQGRTIYSDHVVEGAKVNKAYQQKTFTTTAVPLLAPKVEPKVDKSTVPEQKTQQQIDLENKKIEEGNIAIAKKNCESAKREIALLDSGKRMAKSSSNGEVITLDDAARQQQKLDYQAVMSQNCVR